MSQTHPLISCICVTDNRIDFLKRAITCFDNQNYPNKELVISYPKSDHNTKSFLNELLKTSLINILRVERDKEETIGNARNLAILKCHGDYICVWDDDDWYHPSRLSFQFNSMQTSGVGYNASVLTSVILFDSITKKSYQSSHYTWENTLLCRKEFILQNQYAHRNKGEDTHIIQFLENKRFLHHVDQAPFLYVYIFHGGNTWDYEHYKHLTSKGALLDEEVNQTIMSVL